MNFALPGKLAELAYRPSRELAYSAVESSARGRVQLANTTGDQREVSKNKSEKQLERSSLSKKEIDPAI
jgi:hypothetical protein